MPFKNPNQWVRTISKQVVGFHYEPGSGMRSNGVKSEYFTISGEWVRIRRDVAQVAKDKFGEDLEVVNKIPKIEVP